MQQYRFGYITAGSARAFMASRFSNVGNLAFRHVGAGFGGGFPGSTQRSGLGAVFEATNRTADAWIGCGVSGPIQQLRASSAACR
jgi:hypothetical protein